jgi:murein DD-endopeptidase MepM/ murein hydrolase activator NlpD
MGKILLVGGLIFTLLFSGCTRIPAEAPAPVPLSPTPAEPVPTPVPPATVPVPQTPPSPTQLVPVLPAPKPLEGSQPTVLSEALVSLEREIDVLVEMGGQIGPEHYEELENRLKALEDVIAGDDLSRLEQKLSILRNNTSQNKPAAGQEAEVQPDEPTTIPPEDYVPAEPDPEFDYFTWTLPTGASKLRLILPADIDDFLFSEHGGIGGYGLHAGGHIEGLDHVWIELKPGTPVKSWADGVVTDISYNGPPGEGEYHITIDYGFNLFGIHMEIMTSYVEVGDRVTRGQEVGMGMSLDPHQSSAEMGLVDMGRTDGVRAWGGGVSVSPFDYLERSEKAVLIEAYKKQVIEPYVNNGRKIWGFEPYQPYLTNNLFLHDENKGRLTGAWYLTSSEWEYAYPNDVLTFIEADNPYYIGNVVLAMDRADTYSSDWFIKGTFEVDYAKGQVKIKDNYGPTYYGIFELDESSDRAILKIEYQEGSYPEDFSDNALTYVQRDF